MTDEPARKASESGFANYPHPIGDLSSFADAPMDIITGVIDVPQPLRSRSIWKDILGKRHPAWRAHPSAIAPANRLNQRRD